MTALRVTPPSVAAIADALSPAVQSVFSCSTRSGIQLMTVSKNENARARRVTGWLLVDELSGSVWRCDRFDLFHDAAGVTRSVRIMGKRSPCLEEAVAFDAKPEAASEILKLADTDTPKFGETLAEIAKAKSDVRVLGI